MIACPRCGKENQDHYKFCLGCGAELPRVSNKPPAPAVPKAPSRAGFPAAKPVVAPEESPPHAFAPTQAVQLGGFQQGAVQQVAAQQIPVQQGAASVDAPTPVQPPGGFGPLSTTPGSTASPSAEGDTIACSACGQVNSRAFRFCGACGAPLNASAPVPSIAPQVARGSATLSDSKAQAELVLIRPDGSEGEKVPFSGTFVVGRDAGAVFASDSYLSPKHATLTLDGAEVTLKDENSLNGIYVRIAAETPVELTPNAMFRIGQEFLRFERLAPPKEVKGATPMGSPHEGLVGRICLVIGRESDGNCYTIPEGGIHLGRERGDILFSDDGYVSGLHCRLHQENGKMWLTDLGSSNGTFTRVKDSQKVKAGALFLMGQQLFRLDLRT